MDKTQEMVRSILSATLGARALPATLEPSTPLLGAVPELDSMAVVGVLQQIEEQTGCTIDDDEVSADVFETFGTLCAFVAGKTAT